LDDAKHTLTTAGYYLIADDFRHICSENDVLRGVSPNASTVFSNISLWYGLASTIYFPPQQPALLRVSRPGLSIKSIYIFTHIIQE
jgi:hypothetical protein